MAAMGKSQQFSLKKARSRASCDGLSVRDGDFEEVGRGGASSG